MQILQRQAPNGEWWTKRQMGLVYCADLPIVEVIPGAAPNDATKLAWNPETSNVHNINKETATAAFHNMFREVDTASWSCS
eukprot:9487865-Pyramimonas_sp.AAC.1